jgi:Chalcone isomerase-like
MRTLLHLVVLALAMSMGSAGAVTELAPPERYALRPVGQGSFSWLGLHLYDAALWAPNGRLDFSRPFALVVRYARAFDGETIAARSIEEIERLGSGTPAQRGAWAARLRGAIPDVEAGDQITGVYRPGAGARFYLNGRVLGEIDDPAFSRAFFAIWLDPRTSAPELRAALIGAR